MSGRRGARSTEPEVEPIAVGAPEDSPAAEERYVGDLRVVADDPVPSHLPVRPGAAPKVFHGKRLLTLEDGSKIFECAERDFVGTQGEVAVHRVQEHGAARPGRRRQQPLAEDLVPAEIRSMTIGELVHLAGGISTWEQQFELKEAELEGWRERALAAEAEVRAFQKLLGKAGYVKTDGE